MSTPPLSPWRRTIRTVFQALVGLAVMVPLLVAQTGLDPDQLPWLAGVLAVAAVITRIMALPQVEVFLQQFVPWLAARAKTDQRGSVNLLTLLAVIVVVVIVLFLVGVLR
jgi:hypothetical protein